MLRFVTLCALAVAVLSANTDKRPERIKTVVRGPCEESMECRNKKFGENAKRGNAPCYGLFSCLRAKFYNPGTIKCIGAASCYQGEIKGSPEKLMCSGFKSCQNMQAATAQKVNCDGFQSCTGIKDGLTAASIRCDGALSCTNNKDYGAASLLLEATDNIRCQGKASCVESRVYTDTGSVVCEGDISCVDSSIKAASLSCMGKRSCSRANVQINGDIVAHGWRAFGGALIRPVLGAVSPFTIDAKGAFSLALTNITSQRQDVSIVAKGYKTWRGGYLQCSGMSTCDIVCQGSGCKGATIWVSKAAKGFTVSPAGCDPCHEDFELNGKNKTKSQYGTDCPAIIKEKSCGRPPMEEAAIQAEVQRRKEEAALIAADERKEAEIQRQKSLEGLQSLMEDLLQEQVGMPDLTSEAEIERLMELPIGAQILEISEQMLEEDLIVGEEEEEEEAKEEQLLEEQLKKMKEQQFTLAASQSHSQSHSQSQATTTELLATNAATATGVAVIFGAVVWLYNKKSVFEDNSKYVSV